MYHYQITSYNKKKSRFNTLMLLFTYLQLKTSYYPTATKTVLTDWAHCKPVYPLANQVGYTYHVIKWS